MTDCIPPIENPALGPRQSLYGSFSLALALGGGAIIRAPAKLRAVAGWCSSTDPRRRPSPDQTREGPPRRVPETSALAIARRGAATIGRSLRRFSRNRRPPPDGADQIPQSPPGPGHVPHGRLDPAQVEAAAADLHCAIIDVAHFIPSLTHRRADSDSDSSDDDGGDEISHPNNQHLGYPLMQSLEVGGARLFFASGSAGPAPGLPGQGDGLYRLSDAHENPWILKADTETFAGPCELTNETTRTWITRLKITTKLVVLSKQQLPEQNWERFFSEVAGQPLEQLIVVACSFSDARWSDVHMSQMLTVFEALVDVLFNIKDFPFSRSDEVAGIVNKMVKAFEGVIQRTSNDIRSSRESTVHPATSVFIQVLEFFCRNRDMVQPILDSGDYNTGPCSDMFGCLMSKLKECAETNFQEKGQKYIFFLNNILYVFQKNYPPGLLPPSVVSDLVSLTDEFIDSYLKESWILLIQSYLDGDSLKKPRRSSLNTFAEKFSCIYDSQVTWKVQTKKGLREEIVTLIVPKYVNFLKALQESGSSHSPSMLKWMCRARSEKPVYTCERLEEVIRNLFER